jgi:ferredoxin
MKKIDLFPLADATVVETGAPMIRGLLKKNLKILQSCGGKGLCSTCHVWVRRGAENLSPVGPREKRTLALVADARPESRLACQCQVFGDGVEVEVPEGMYIESADDLIALLGTQAAQNILHPVTGVVLIPKGKLITRTLLEQSRGVAADLLRAKTGGAGLTESGSTNTKSFLASGSGHRPSSVTSTHHTSRTVYTPKPPAVPVPNAANTTPTPRLPPPPARPTDPFLHLSTLPGGPIAGGAPGGNSGRSDRLAPSTQPNPQPRPEPAARQAAAPQPGAQIGKYLLIECIGRGGSGMVYRALHTKLKTPVAVKFLRPDVLAGDPDALPRLTQEAQLLAQLIHPNVVRVLDFEDDPARPFVVMEFVDGLSAADLVKQSGRVSPGRTVEIGLHVLEGLDAARRLGIVHRDVKPGNILLTRDGASKLVDLGLAVVSRPGGQADGSGSATAEGTVGYMSPEQALGSAVDHRADQYSLGCTLFHLLTGRLPFVGHSPHDVLLKHLRAPVPAAHEVSPAVPVELSRIVQTMMEKSADDRYPSYAALRAELASLAVGVTAG